MAIAFTPVPNWFSQMTQGAGVAVADLDGNGRPELIVFQIDNPVGQNTGYYKIGWNLDAIGAVTGGWSNWIAIPDWFPGENQGGGIAIADLDGNGRPELIVFQIDNPVGQNAAYYKIGWNLDATGVVTGGWSNWIAVPDWFSWENQGGGIAIADLDGNGRPELIVFQIDNPVGQNAAYYKIGWNLNATGVVTGGWSNWIAVPDWFPWENQGAGIAVADLDGNGRPELIVFQIDNPPEQNVGYYQIGWNLDTQGNVTSGWSPWSTVPDWFSWENGGGNIAIADLAGKPTLLVFMIDTPPNQSQGYYRAVDVTALEDMAANGWWGLLPYNTPVLPVHTALLHTNKLFFFAGSSNNPDNFNNQIFRSVVWDYAAGTFEHPQTPIDFFCCGHSFLLDGRLLVVGGTEQYDPFHGLKDAYIFDPATEQWAATKFMAGGRWYPTLVTLGDGRVLAVSGQAEDGTLNVIPEVYTDPDGWQALPNNGNWPLYAHLYLIRDGRIFYAGGQYNDNKGMRPGLIDVNTGNVTVVSGLTAVDQRNQCASVLLPPAQDQRVMIIGGGSDDSHMAPIVATNNVNVVNLAAGNPVYTQVAPLNFARMHLNAVLLPDHTVLVSGGSFQEEMADQATLDAEIYNPVTNTWTVVARSRVPRLYHSVAILLPDGRVVTAGSNPMRKDEELRMEIYYPSYLYRGARPVITNVAQEVTYGAKIEVQTAQANATKWVSLIRPGATTHSNDTEQRLVDLAFLVSAADMLDVTIPNEPNLAPPGWYMLFITNQEGIPSVAQWVHLVH